jgi:hypothetical protein
VNWRKLSIKFILTCSMEDSVVAYQKELDLACTAREAVRPHCAAVEMELRLSLIDESSLPQPIESERTTLPHDAAFPPTGCWAKWEPRNSRAAAAAGSSTQSTARRSFATISPGPLIGLKSASGEVVAAWRIFRRSSDLLCHSRRRRIPERRADSDFTDRFHRPSRRQHRRLQ